jgi:hypothetical protein
MADPNKPPEEGDPRGHFKGTTALMRVQAAVVVEQDMIDAEKRAGRAPAVPIPERGQHAGRGKGR